MASEETRIRGLEESIRVAANTILPCWEQFPDCPAKWFEPKNFENDSERVYGLIRRSARDNKKCEEIKLSNTEQEVEHMWRFLLEFVARKQNTTIRNRLIETCHGLVTLNVIKPRNWASSREKILELFGVLEEDFFSILGGEEVVLKDIIRKTRNEEPTSETGGTGSKYEGADAAELTSFPPLLAVPLSDQRQRFSAQVFEDPPKKKTVFARVCNCMR